MNVDRSVMDKIRKLRNLSERAGTVHEAAAAAAMLGNLLIKHQLDMNDVERAGLHERYLKEDHSIGHKTMWARSLFGIIARNNFCSVVYTARSDKMTIVGERDNIDTTYEMFDWLSIELLRLCQNGWETEGKYQQEQKYDKYGWFIGVGPVHGRKWKSSFLTGAAYEVDKILREQRKQFIEVNDAQALVIDREAEIDRMADEMFGRTRTHRSKVTHKGAFQSGKNAAGKINFNKHVSGGTLALKG